MNSNKADFEKMSDSKLRSICNLGSCYQFREMARLELAGRGYSYYEGMKISDPEHGNGQVAPEEVKRVQEEVKMNNQQHRSDEQIERIKQDMKKRSNDELRSVFAAGDDRYLAALAYAELSARFSTSSAYEVTAMDGCEVIDRHLKRAISSEYVDSLLDHCDEVRIRKVNID